MKEKCEIIRDLLPLVQDGVASEASCRLVREHLETCEECRSAYSLDPLKMPDETLDRRLIASVRKAFFLMGIVLLLIGALVGVAVTDSMNVFYNFILMPGLGMLGYWLFRGKSLLVPLGIFLLAYLFQIPGTGFADSFPMAVLYALLCGLGLGIGFLLDYAFAREGKK